jgi:hypothetical protein
MAILQNNLSGLLPLLPGLTTRPHLALPPIIEHPLIIEFPQRNNDINGIYDLICLGISDIWGDWTGYKTVDTCFHFLQAGTH